MTAICMFELIKNHFLKHTICTQYVHVYQQYFHHFVETFSDLYFLIILEEKLLRAAFFSLERDIILQ